MTSPGNNKYLYEVNVVHVFEHDFYQSFVVVCLLFLFLRDESSSSLPADSLFSLQLLLLLLFICWSAKRLSLSSSLSVSQLWARGDVTSLAVAMFLTVFTCCCGNKHPTSASFPLHLQMFCSFFCFHSDLHSILSLSNLRPVHRV